MIRVSVSSIAAASMTALFLAGCGGGDRAAPSVRSVPQFAYYDSQGRLVYRGGPLYDANGAPLNPIDPRRDASPARQAPPVVTPVVAPNRQAQDAAPQPAPQLSGPAYARPEPQARQSRLRFTQPQVQPQSAPRREAPQPQSRPAAQPTPQPSRAFPQTPGGPRFDAQGNLIPLDDGVVAPEFDASGNLIQPGAAPAAPAPISTRPSLAPLQTAAVQTAPIPPVSPTAPAARPTPPPASQRRSAPASRAQPPAPARISGDPRVTAAFDVSGTSWIVKTIGGRPVRGGMTLYFVVAGAQRMAIVESVCDQEIGAFEGGRGGSLTISGLAGCAADRGLTGALSSARRFAISADKQRMQLIDETGAPIATLTSLVSS